MKNYFSFWEDLAEDLINQNTDKSQKQFWSLFYDFSVVRYGCNDQQNYT